MAQDEQSPQQVGIQNNGGDINMYPGSMSNIAGRDIHIGDKHIHMPPSTHSKWILPDTVLNTVLISIHRYRKIAIIILMLSLFLLLFLGYHPPRALLSNQPPKLNRPIQEENNIMLKWNINGWYDKYNVLIFKERQGKLPEQTQVSDIRGSDWRIKYVESYVTYHFLVEGCVEERFFELTLHSSCTSWSPEEILITIPSAVERKYEDMQQKYRQNDGIDWGKPISLEEYDGGGWYHQDYDNGVSIYWNKHVGTAMVYGSIAQEWKQQGRGASPLGYPTKDEHDWLENPGGRITCFQHGTITWSPEDKDHVTVNMLSTCV